MAVPWLDLVRFADTVGYHGDQNQRIFPYRDYVIDAFNRNKPFDQFTIEQLAGDLLPNPTASSSSPRVQPPEHDDARGRRAAQGYLAKYAGDRVRTVSNAWLGSTMGCCECHDHKFDPFTTKDFYRSTRSSPTEAMGRVRGLQLHAEPRAEGLEQRSSVPAGDRSGQPLPECADGRSSGRRSVRSARASLHGRPATRAASPRLRAGSSRPRT